MKTYFFSMGTHPSLSIAELNAVLNNQKILFEKIFTSDKIFLIKTKNLPTQIIKELGGTIKFGEILTIEKSVQAESLYQLIDYHGQEKFYFGISTYHTGKIKNLSLGLQIKKLLKTNQTNARFVSSKENPLSSVVVAKNKLLTENGIEFIIIEHENKFFIGKTLQVQDFEEYSKIDYNRPVRNEIQGMLPPKIAQIMINLAQIQKTQTILDPFCGSGTILQMAAKLGYKNLIGTDKNPQAIKDTRENLTWLANEYKVDFHLRLHETDIKHLQKHLSPKTADAIIFEPYMGPPIKASFAFTKMQEIMSGLTALYKTTFEEIKKIIKPDGTLVVIIPHFEFERGKNFYLDLKNIFDGYNIINKYKYSRPGQKVIRNIYILKR